MKQDEIFFSSEGDQWFSRNKEALKKKPKDLVMELLHKKNFLTRESTVLEVGCANGYRLNSIQTSYKSKCHGIDASAVAIKNGQSDFHELLLEQAKADQLPFENDKFDLVIINFVLHWIDRKNLFKVISEIDRVLKEQGHLIIGDFYPLNPQKVPYHHLPEKNVFTYKQHYFEIFKQSNLYELLDLWTYDHTTLSVDVQEPSNRCFLSLLKKESLRSYADP